MMPQLLLAVTYVAQDGPIRRTRSHPAYAEDKAGLTRTHAHEAEAQLPVEPVLADERDEGQSHGSAQHVEDAGHIVHIQLAGHHLVLLVVTDSSQPQGLQLLHLT